MGSIWAQLKTASFLLMQQHILFFDKLKLVFSKDSYYFHMDFRKVIFCFCKVILYFFLSSRFTMIQFPQLLFFFRSIKLQCINIRLIFECFYPEYKMTKKERTIHALFIIIHWLIEVIN